LYLTSAPTPRPSTDRVVAVSTVMYSLNNAAPKRRSADDQRHAGDHEQAEFEIAGFGVHTAAAAVPSGAAV
jgi:hypothetical protein